MIKIGDTLASLVIDGAKTGKVNSEQGVYARDVRLKGMCV